MEDNQEPIVTEKELRHLLASELRIQRRSYHRASMFIGLLALVGAAWLAFSAINVVRLEGKATNLKAQSTELQQNITLQTQQISQQKEELEAQKKELATATDALRTVQKNLTEGRTQEALRVASNAIRVRTTSAPAPTPVPVGGESFNIRFRPDESLDYISMNLNAIQANRLAELVSLAAEPDRAGNTATFRMVDIERASHIPPITLVALPEGQESSVIASQRARGRTLIVQSSIMVNGRLTRVAAFR